MNTTRDHFRGLPRLQLQRELRQITGDDKFSLWEFMGLGWMYRPVRADAALAARLGVDLDDVIGYHVLAGHVFGGALSDLMNVDRDTPDYPDPFR